MNSNRDERDEKSTGAGTKLTELFQKYLKAVTTGSEDQALSVRRLIRDERDKLDRQ
jgi:hypothetical protein